MNKFINYNNRKYFFIHSLAFITKTGVSFFDTAFRIADETSYIRKTLLAQPYQCSLFFDDLIMQNAKPTFNYLTTDIYPVEIYEFPKSEMFLTKDGKKHLEKQEKFFDKYFSFLRDKNINNEQELLVHSVFLIDVYAGFYKKGNAQYNSEEEHLNKTIIQAMKDDRLKTLFTGFNQSDITTFNSSKKSLISNLIDHYPIVLSSYF